MPWETELVNSFYGLLGLGAMCALRYLYPSVKKFLIRKFGNGETAPRIDPKVRDQILLSLQEILSGAERSAEQ
jgi:hypothetical protein